MVEPHDGHQSLARDLDGLDGTRLRLKRPHEAKVETAIKDGIDLLVSRHLLQDQIDIGVCGAKLEDEFLKALHEGGGAEESDFYFAQKTAMYALGTHGRNVDALENLQCFFQERLSCVRQFDASVRPLKQARANLAFQREDLLAQWRL